MSEILSKIDVNDYNVQAMEGGSPKLQEKTATPSTSQQVVEPDEGYDGMSSVTVGAVTSAIDENIIPTNIRTGKTILGVQGNLEPDKPDQSKTVTPTTSEQVIVGDTGYELASVTVEAIQTETKTVKSTTSSQTVTPTSGKFINEITVNPIVLEDVTVKSTTSSQTITPTSGKDGIGEITVNPINLESKDVSISTNGTTTITPTSGYDGISDVDVTVSGILDTSDANATASDIISNKTAYVNGQKITGSIAVKGTLTNTADNVSDIGGKLMVQSFHTGESARVAVDTNSFLNIETPYYKIRQATYVTANKILAGYTVLGLAGTATSDADATAGDIASGKTAYVNGVKLTGAYTPTAISEKDVNFYDYDGTLVDSYTKSEFANLSALPANPSHTGLTAQGWNWTLSDAKTYVADCGKLNIGQMYVTDDNKTRIYITLEEGRLSPYLGCSVNGTVTIDWGDGTTETAAGSDYPLYKQHNYSSAGDYVITLAGNADINIVGSATYGSYLLSLSTIASYNDAIYRNAIKKLELNNRTNIGTAGLYKCGSISTITTHNNMTNFGSTAFTWSSLKSIVIPSSITTITNGQFSDCRSLVNISLPNSITKIEQSAFARDYSLHSITIPKATATIGQQVFYNCYSLRYASLFCNSSTGSSIFSGCSILEYLAIANTSTTIPSYFVSSDALRIILIPDSVTTIQNSSIISCKSLSNIKMSSSITDIGNYTFYDCTGIKFYDFTDSVSVPTLGGSNVFDNIANDCKIIVPDNLYDSWIAASYWSNLSSYIIRESDWE